MTDLASEIFSYGLWAPDLWTGAQYKERLRKLNLTSLETNKIIGMIRLMSLIEVLKIVSGQTQT